MNDFNEQELADLVNRPKGRIDPVWTKEEIEEDEKENKKLKRIQMANASKMKRAQQPKRTKGFTPYSGGGNPMFGMFAEGVRRLDDANRRTEGNIARELQSRVDQIRDIRTMNAAYEMQKLKEQGANYRAEVAAQAKANEAAAQRNLMMEQLAAEGKVSKHKIKKVGPQGRQEYFEYRPIR